MPRMMFKVVVLLWVSLSGVAHAQPAASVQIVLAVDASGSVNTERFMLQKHGYAAAFRDPDVQSAIHNTATGAIAVMMVQWTGPTLHIDVVDWTLIGSAAAANRFADAVDAAPRALFGGGTSISGAIDHAMTLFSRAPWQAERRVIDISGDGPNNRGRAAEEARDAAVGAGVTINGLPILALEPELDAYYRNSVIGGPGAFVIAVRSYDEFAGAIRKKLLQEIALR